jgi:putative PEP-CTERM system histidine kinase
MAIPFGTVSYAAAAAAYLFLFLLLVTSWRGRLQGILLALACLCSVLWASALAYGVARPDASPMLSDVLEVTRSTVWYGFLLVILGYSRQEVGSLRRVAAGIFAFCAVVLVATLFTGGISAARPGIIDILSRLGLAVTGMVLVEQLYRNVRPDQRWGVKFLCFGIGAMFACDFYLYSDTLLFRRINDDIWTARGIVNTLVVPMIAIAAARNPKWSLDIFVSRGILFHSAAMLGAAGYLLVMAGTGYYIRYFGGTWGAVLQVTFLFGAVLLLFIILFSGTVRARLKVFLSKNFFSYRYDYREEWLRFTRTLSEGEPGVQLRERSIEAIAELVDSPGGSLWLMQDAGVFEQSARWNMVATTGTEQPDSSLCQFLEKRQWVVDLNGYQSHPELYSGLLLPGWLNAIPQAWLVVPLIHHEQLLGFVVLARSKGRINLNWEINDLLKTAGRQAASYLAQLETARALLIARQFESFNRMSAFVVHDLKNLVSQLSLLLSNADKHKHNPAFQEDMLDTVSNSVEKVKRLLAQLRGGHTLDPPGPVQLNELLRAVVDAKSAHKPRPRLEVADQKVQVMAHGARLERVMGHFVQNAIEATPAEGSVMVRLSPTDSEAVITVTDTGCGMSEQFIRYRLFKPFESTKVAGMGIGTYEARQYLREIGGRVEVDSRESQGTVFRVILPLMSERETAGHHALEAHA